MYGGGIDCNSLFNKLLLLCISYVLCVQFISSVIYMLGWVEK